MSSCNVFMVMAYQACLSNDTDFWASGSHHTINKGVYVPT